MIAALTLVALMSVQPAAVDDEERPSTGLGLTIAGAVLTGLGALNLGTSPICRAEFYRDQVGDTGSDVCLVGSLAFGGVLFVIGLPMLIVGLVKRSAYKEWVDEQDVALRFDPERMALVW